MKRSIGLLLILLIVGLQAFPQKSAIKKGNKKTKRGEYNEAIAYYEKALESKEYKGESSFQIAEAYRNSNRLIEALPYYRDAINSRYDDPNAYFYYAFALKANGEYAEAEAQLRRFVEISEDEFMKNWAEKEIDNLS